MAYHDPQASLENIRRMQARTRDEYVRHGFDRRYVIAVAVVLFVAIASRDLPEPWGGVVSLLAVGLLVAMAVAHGRRAAVHRPTTKKEIVVVIGAVVVMLGALAGFAAAAHALDLPAPYTFAGAALAVTSVVTARWTRQACAAIIRR